MYTRYHAGFTFAVPFGFSFLGQNSYYIRKMYSLMHVLAVIFTMYSTTSIIWTPWFQRQAG